MKAHKALWLAGITEAEQTLVTVPQWRSPVVTNTSEFELIEADYLFGRLNGLRPFVCQEERAMYCWFFALFFEGELEV